MSFDTIGEVAIWMLISAVLGFALGWLAYELRVRSWVTPPAPAPAPAPTPTPAPAPTPTPAPAPAPPAAPAPTPAPKTAPTPQVEPAAAMEPGPHPGSALALPDGSAPSPEHTIKVSGSSKIYHGPSSPAYARTTAAFWFVDAEAAEKAGFRKPKNG